MKLRIALAGACLTLVSGCSERDVPDRRQNQDMDEAAGMLDDAPGELARVNEAEFDLGDDVPEPGSSDE